MPVSDLEDCQVYRIFMELENISTDMAVTLILHYNSNKINKMFDIGTMEEAITNF